MKMNSFWPLVLVGCMASAPGWAYPPAPHHLIYGCVRDQYGTPLTTADSQIILQTRSGARIQTAVCPGLGLGFNYSLLVPMDAGLTPDLYEPAALKVAAPFKIYVVFNQSTNLPIQMTGNFINLGQPGGQTRLDLTLGSDVNGDGIPDEWELALLAQLGLSLDLGSLNANLDLLGNGRALWQEFLMGNALFNPADGFAVKLVGVSGGSPILEFTTMTGRSYALLGSTDLQTWNTLSFTIPAEGTGLAHSYCYTADIRTLQIQAVQPPSAPPARFFRLVLQ